MDWKEYQETPEDGMFETIQKRLRVRRVWRIGGVVAVVAVAVVAAVALLTPESELATESAISTAEVAVAPQGNEELRMKNDELAAAPGNSSFITHHSSFKATEHTTVPASADIVSADDDVAELLPQSQMQMASFDEPEADLLFDENLFSKLSALPEVDRKDEKRQSKAEEPVADGANAKLGGMEPTPYHEDNLLWAPNIIVLNGDNPDNRVFKVVTSSTVQEFHIHIYNRGGRLVFSSSDVNAVWDATVGGSAAPQGAYVWVATFRDSEGVSRREAGTVTIVR